VKTKLVSILSDNKYQKLPLILFASTILAVGGFSVPVYAADKSAPVDFVADNLAHDDKAQKIIATGNVELAQSGRIVNADKVVYDLKQDRVTAEGNVALTDEEGNVYFADSLDLSNEFKDGFAEKIRVELLQGDYFWADNAERKDGTVTVMNDARYTPCEPCKENPNKAPAWSINAQKVTHDDVTHSVTYNNAWFEFFGVPVAYTPYFAHADGTVKQKSGFLAPSATFDSELGAGAELAYYWGIAPDMDATVGLQLYTQETPLLTGEFRKRFADASLLFKGSVTESGRTERSAGTEFEIDDEVRGHFEGVGLWNINENWRAGFDVEVVSDNQYLNQYNISGEDLLESEAYVEWFNGRNYATSKALFFQDLRIDKDIDQPNVLPEAGLSLVQDAGKALGGRFALDMSMLGLRREGSDQDMNRASARAGWARRFIGGYGLVTDIDAYVHGDVYHIRDIGDDNDKKTEERIYPVLNFKSELPVARPFEKFQMVIAPVAGMTIAPDLNESDENDIVNEDSLDVRLDATNLFEASRFPGLDRVEDDIKATYGLRTGFYGYEGSHAEFFIGQSYRFDDDDNPFARGSGLSRQRSDFVGSVNADFLDTYHVDYRYQLNGTTMNAQRHEISAHANWDRFTLAADYFYARSYFDGNNDNDEDIGSREQIDAGATYRFLPDWRFRLAGRYDLGVDEGLRQADFGLDYLGQCLSISSTLRRNLTDDSSGDSSTEFFIRIGLKNLGEFIGGDE
jgi:LPS-assembly protein